MRLKMITEYKRDGYDAHLVKSERISDTGHGYPRYVCIFERTKGGAPSHYEVIVLRGVGPSVIRGKPFPARLLLPSPEQWGRLGWSHTQLQQAEHKMRQVCNDKT